MQTKYICIPIYIFTLFLSSPLYAQKREGALKLLGQGLNIYKQEKYEDAFEYFKKSLEISNVLNDQELIGMNLWQIGKVYQSRKQYNIALTYYDDAEKIARKLNIPEFLADILSDHSEVFSWLGHYKKALIYLNEELRIRKELGSTLPVSNLHNEIGTLCSLLGHYEKAIEHYDEALRINNLVYFNQKQTLEQKELDDVAPVIMFETSKILLNLGVVYTEIGQYDKAIDIFDNIITIRGLPLISSALNNLGGVYAELGQFNRAISLYEEALALSIEQNAPWEIALSHSNIGLAYLYLGQHNKALFHAEKAQSISKVNKFPANITAQELLIIGNIYLLQKNYKEAEKRFYEVNNLVKDSDDKNKGTGGIVDVYIATGKYLRALYLLEQIAPDWNNSDPYLIEFNTRKGYSLIGVKRFKDASYELLKAVTLIEDIKRRVHNAKDFLKGRTKPYRGLVEVLSDRALLGERADKRFVLYGASLTSNAFYFSELTKARNLLKEIAYSARMQEKNEMPSSLIKKEQDLQFQISAVDNLWVNVYTKSKEGFKELVDRKKKLKKDLDALISQIRKDYPRYVALNYPKPFPAEELPLRSDEVLLEYAVTDDATYLFVVRKGGVERIVKVDVGKQELESLV